MKEISHVNLESYTQNDFDYGRFFIVVADGERFVDVVFHQTVYDEWGEPISKEHSIMIPVKDIMQELGENEREQNTIV